MRIGLFSLKDAVGCTSMSIHIANFLASDPKNKVALCEIGRNAKYKTAKVEFQEDGTFSLNNVHYYPNGCEVTITEDFIVDDIGKIGVLYKFADDYDKIYLCTDGSDADLDAFVVYKEENHINADIILFGGSKECVHKWQEEKLRVILIGKTREKRLPQNLAMAFSTFLRLSDIIPPVYKNDAIFSPIIFNGAEVFEENDPLEEKPEETKEPAPFYVKSFVKVPEPTDVYKEAREKDDGKGIAYEYDEKDRQTEKSGSNKETDVSVTEAASSNDIEYEDESKRRLFGKKTKRDGSDTDTQDNKESDENKEKSSKKGKNDKKEKASKSKKDKAQKVKKEPEKPSLDIEYEDDEEEKTGFKAILSNVLEAILSFAKKFGKGFVKLCKKIAKRVFKKNFPEEIDEDYHSSLLGEIPMDCKDFSFDEEINLKDIAEYSIFTTKRDICFGLKKNVHKHHYDNSDETLLNLTKANKEVLQFFSEDLLSGEYTLRRFTAEDIDAMRSYFDFMCHLFEREISKTVTLREYIEFKQYYNRLCETKLMLDAEENERRRIIHDIYVRYYAYSELYNIDIKDEQLLIDENIVPFIEGLSVILNDHVCDEDVKGIIKGLIEEINALVKPKFTEPESAVNVLDTNVPEPTFTEDPDVDESIDIISKSHDDIDISNVTTHDAKTAISNLSTKNDPEKKHVYRLLVLCFNENEEIDDKAKYSIINMERAVYTYMRKSAFIKQLLLIDENDNTTLLYSSKNGGIIIPAKGDFNDEILSIKEDIENLMSDY